MTLFEAHQVARVRTRPGPVVNWPGGKTQLLRVLHGLVPLKYGTYFEPFFGGGALFFHLEPARAVVGDLDREVINLYRQLARDPETIIGHLRTLRNEKVLYLEVRDLDWRELDPVYAAARTIYLSKTGFNGLRRLNKEGNSTVAFGANPKALICQPHLLRAVSSLLARTRIVRGDFTHTLKTVKRLDFVFLDPPYIPVNESGFTTYGVGTFTDEDQEDLANEVRRLDQLGARFVLTNSDHPIMYDLYKGFKFIRVAQARKISGKKGSATHDLVVHN